MKNLISVLLIAMAISTIKAQTPQAFKYQSVVRDAAGEVLANQAISFRISIHDGSTSGTIVYQETHSTATNDFGLVNLEIGTESPLIGTFNNIDWGSEDKFLEIELDPNNGNSYVSMGASQLLSVPFALFSENTANADDNDWTRNGDYIYTINDSIGIGTSSPGAKLDVAGAIWQSNTGESVFLGLEAGLKDDGSDNQNVFIGQQAGFSNTSGGRNTFIGYRSGFSITESNYNTFVGRQSGYNSINTTANTFIGNNSGYNNISGQGNTFLGESSGVNNLSGNGNIFIGYKSGQKNDIGSDNIALGGYANFNNQGGINNTIVGSRAGYGISEHNKSGNTFLGYMAGYYEQGNNKLYIENSDADSANALIYGDFDNDLLALNARVGIGTASPATLFSNSSDLVLDLLSSTAPAGLNWKVEDLNYAVGIENSSNGGNGLLVKAGNNAGTGAIVAHFVSNDTSLLYIREDGNIGIGTSTPGAALDVAGHIWQSNIGGSVMIGKYAGFYDDGTNNFNLFIGSYSGYQNTSGNGNVFVGANSGSSNTEGYHNSIVGYNSRFHNSTGIFNTTIGAFSDHYNQNGDGNTVLGYAAGMGEAIHDKHYNIFIGYRAGFNESGNHRLYIENSDAGATDALIYGEFDNDILALNANVGIRTTTPNVPLHVVGGTDASLTGGGYIVAGQITSENIAIDDNEIMARLSGIGGNLFINRDGANVILNQFAGSVGIGTQGPAAKLHVNGSVRLGSGVRNYEILEVDPSYPDGWSPLISYGGIAIGSNDGTNRQMFMFTDGSTTDNIFTVATSQNNGASWEADLVIRQDGNIGINTSTPARKLHINDVMRLEPRSSAPSGASAGDLYFDGITHKLRCYDGAVWQDCW